MRHLKEILEEAKKEKEKKIVFVETDGREAFPENTVNALEKDINKKAKDLSVEWKNSVELVDKAFEELEVPKPKAFQSERWEQYKDLLRYAIKSLSSSRGFKGGWTQTI